MKLNQKKKKKKMCRPIKAHRIGRPVNRPNRPVYRYEPVELSFFNSNLNSTGTDWFPAKPDRYTGTGPRRFGRIDR